MRLSWARSLRLLCPVGTHWTGSTWSSCHLWAPLNDMGTVTELAALPKKGQQRVGRAPSQVVTAGPGNEQKLPGCRDIMVDLSELSSALRQPSLFCRFQPKYRKGHKGEEAGRGEELMVT